MAMERGTVIGRIGRPGEGPYGLLAPVGAGRDTEVWRAESLRSGETVAVKVYPRWYGADRGYVQRFLRTARASQQARHTNLLAVIEAGEDDGHTYLVTPLAEGGSLEDRLDGRPWTLAAAVALLEPLATGLDALHAHGVVHGNLKPSNVLLGEGAGADAGERQGMADHVRRPLLSDPLIVRPVAASDAPGQFDLLLGSPTYTSPEQASGASLDTCPASDRYSLGALAYHLLTGRPPFVGDAPLGLLLNHIVKLPPSACALNPDLPPRVERSLAVMLAKDPDRRFATAAAFVEALQSARAASVPRASVPRPRLLPAVVRTEQRASGRSVADETRGDSRALVALAAGRAPAGPARVDSGPVRVQTGPAWRCRLGWSAP